MVMELKIWCRELPMLIVVGEKKLGKVEDLGPACPEDLQKIQLW